MQRIDKLTFGMESVIRPGEDYSPEIARTLRALMEIRTLEDYPDHCNFIILLLEKHIDEKSGIPKNSRLAVDIDFKALTDIAKEFEFLDTAGVERVEGYLDNILEPKTMQLRHFFSQRLRLPVQTRYYIKDIPIMVCKITCVFNAMTYESRAEHFTMKDARELSLGQVSGLLRAYYEQKGYAMTQPRDGIFFFKNEKEIFNIHVRLQPHLEITASEPITRTR